MAFQIRSTILSTATLLLATILSGPISYGETTADELIAQLADPDPAKQADARQKLLAIGDAAKPALERIAKSRGATESLLKEIETNRLAGPTYVTLKMDNASIDAVLKALSQQTGYSLKPYNDGMWGMLGKQTKISVDYNKTPFWDAVIDLCRKGQICPYPYGNAANQLNFIASAQMGTSSIDCPLSIKGGAIAMFTNLSRQKAVVFGDKNSINSDFSGSLLLMIEPKLVVTRYGYQPIVDEAVDDNGNSLLPPSRGESNDWNTASRQMQLNVGVNLKYPEKNAGTKISRLRLRLKVSLATRSEKLEFTDLSGQQEQTLATPSGRKMTLIKVKPSEDEDAAPGRVNNRQYVAQVKIHSDQFNPQQFDEYVQSPALKLLDAKGREWSFQTVQDVHRSGSDRIVSVLFYRRAVDDDRKEVGTPTKMVWEVPIETRDIELPFEFKDLPIP